MSRPLFCLGTHQPHWLCHLPAVRQPPPARAAQEPAARDLPVGAGLRRIHRTVALRPLGRHPPRTTPPPPRYVEQVGGLDFAAPQDWMCEPAPRPHRPDRPRPPGPHHRQLRPLARPGPAPAVPNTDYHEWKTLLREAGLREVRLHDARHTAATVLLILAVPTPTAMAIMGWSSAVMAKRYQHVLDSIRRDVARQVGGLLWETGSAREDSGPDEATTSA